MDVLESGPEGGWERPRGALVPALLAALAVAVAAAVALAVALYVDVAGTYAALCETRVAC